VIDSCSVVGGNRKVWEFELDGRLRPVSQRLVYDFGGGRGGDGMAVDQNGILHVAAGILHARGPHESGAVPPGIYRISPVGELLGRIPIPEDTITNVTFGGPDLKTLYITAGKTLYSAASPVPGWVVHRNAKN
jgi:gluconolactonase